MKYTIITTNRTTKKVVDMTTTDTKDKAIKIKELKQYFNVNVKVQIFDENKNEIKTVKRFENVRVLKNNYITM